jgi:formate-dependent nitrite reductase membrane component NrfD
MPEPRWGLLIVLYLFLGGLSAGTFAVGALAAALERFGIAGYGRLARVAALVAPWPVALGSALLVFDLGHWWRFYKLFVTFEWTSPMSIGAWLLALFTGVTLAAFWSVLDRRLLERAVAAVPRRLRRPFGLLLWQGREGLRRPLMLAGAPLAVAVGIYTGVLLGAVQARPFWNTNLVAQMFLFSALSTGCATLLLLAAIRRAPDWREIKLLVALDIGLIALELLIVVPYVIHGALSPKAVRDALALILGGPYTLAFWGLFILGGLLTPLAMEIWDLREGMREGGHRSRLMPAASAALVLVGGFVLRYVFVLAGQASAFQ